MKGSARTPSHSRKPTAIAALAVLLPALLAAGCATGPEYKKPEVSPPAQFRSQVQQANAASITDSPWWSVFNDDALRSLITQSLAANLDVQVAVTRIEQARALVGVAQSESHPQLGYQASAGGQNTFVAGKSSADTVSYASFGGLLNAAWE